MATDRIIIVGAGPCGLVTASYLAAEGIPVLLIEALEAVPDDLRASTFHPPSLDFLDRFGVTELLIANGLVCPQWQFRDRKQGAVATFDLKHLAGETKHPYRLQCEQWKLTRILRDRLEKDPKAEIVYQSKAVGVEQTADGVTLICEHQQRGTERHQGRFLVASDGAHSAVRRSLGIEFEGITIPELYLTLSTSFPFHEQMPALANIAYISDPEEWLVLLRTPSLWRVLFPTDPAETDEAMLSPERVEQRLQGVVPSVHRYEVIHKTAYRVQERVAARYVQGRIALAGDAAHINNPLGGMGMNGGMHDAMNLADKLVQIWRGGDPALLGRYERQRRKVAIETVQATSLRNRQILNVREPDKRKAYYDDLATTANDPVRAKEFLMRTSMIQSLRDLEQVA